MARYICNSLFFFFFIVITTSVYLASSQDQRTIITTIAQNLNISTSIWNTTNDPCTSWKGVKCVGESITQLSFSKFGISSSGFLADLCKINSLQSLDVSNNQIGTIPVGFFDACGKLTGLKILNFSNSGLSGSLHAFTGFVALEVLDLSSNSLGGSINLQLDGLISIRSLNLSGNKLEGSVPTHLGRNMVLQELQLSKNGFSGPVHEELMNYTNLTLLDLSSNELFGSIPVNIGELSKLEVLILSSNNLRGIIPPTLLGIKTLSRFSANLNSFNGTIPQGISQSVRILDLSYNQLSGLIPEDLLSAPNLESIDLKSNQLKGTIPERISQNLFRLRLSSNSLNGSIPPSVGKLLNLMYLELDANQLTGNIPLELENCSKLALLNLAKNQLEGSLSKGLGNLVQLVVMNLNGNQFIGDIPAEISQLKNLSLINLGRNLLTGQIPSGITRLQKLSILNLEHNRLTGPIPPAIGELDSLLELQLGSNRLTGSIPTMPLRLQIALNLSSNQFGGPIPSTLSGLASLEVLDLSNNQFTGNVPAFLVGLGSLTELVLSNNHLSGTLPQFSSRVKVEYDGNKDLRVDPRVPTTNPNIISRRKRNLTVLVPAVAVAGGVLAIAVVAVLLIASRRFYRVDDENQGLEENLPQVINGHFITMDSIHRSSIDFTRAMEAVGNPVNVMLKCRFSTYYKALMPCGRSYCVKKLNWSDKIFQLGNHDKFGRELEILGRLNNSSVMIPLAYVLTSDNAYLFYEHSHMGTVFDFLHKSSSESLDWTCRYSIALGVAQGLCFLHGCSDPVLLLDLSTKTILLKSLTEPQIADVELSKVIDPSKSTGSLSTVAGSVGYIPPEYAYTMRVTMAGNVYSFGVVLLELLTGKPSVSEGTELAKWVLSNSAQVDSWEQILDSSLSKTSVAVRNQMLSVLKIAQACVSVSPAARPKMKNVVRMLLNVR